MLRLVQGIYLVSVLIFIGQASTALKLLGLACILVKRCIIL